MGEGEERDTRIVRGLLGRLGEQISKKSTGGDDLDTCKRKEQEEQSSMEETE